MWIHFSKRSYGSSGGGLNEPFRHFGRIIADKFQSDNIEFPYGEIEIGLAFPSSKAKDNQKYCEWFDKLPHYYRSKTMVRVTLLMMEEEEENITSVLQFINKAFEIIVSKKKKEDGFETVKLKASLFQLGKELQEINLWELNNRYENIIRKEAIEKRKQQRAIREQANEEKKKLIYDLRFMYYLPNIGNLYFSPYSERFCDLILEKLREIKFRLPNYTHLYIMVSDTLENSLYHAVRAENWFVYGITAIKNHSEYPRKNEIEKQRIVFDLIKQGLNDIAKIDKLDTQSLNEALDEVEQQLFNRKQQTQ